jgi:D-alanine-D-alanine ligase
MEHVLVLQGGNSSERDVSLRSGANVSKQLQEAGYTVSVADPAAADFDLETFAENVDVVLPILHGAGGEDGVLQAELERLRVPFLGAGSEACAITFDKAAYRALMAEQGILMARGEVVDLTAFNGSTLRKSPYVLKPVDGGSSVDTIILHDMGREPDDDFYRELFSRHPQMLLEELVIGDELTVGVLGTEALPVIYIVPPNGEEFDYENKYNGRTQEIVNPAQIASEAQQKAQELALRLHQVTGCRHLSRSDMILTPEGKLYVLETNTMPGMTEQSLFPKMAAANGMDMRALVSRFVELAKGL